MGGQSAVTPDGGAGNEDVGIVEMDVWVHGCKALDPSPETPGDAKCGDGVNEGAGERCDLGAGNGWGSTCSLACTSWNPESCSRFGGAESMCPAPPKIEVTAQYAPGKENLGAQVQREEREAEREKKVKNVWCMRVCGFVINYTH